MIHDLVDRLIPWLDDWLHRFGWRSDRICWMAEVTYSWGPDASDWASVTATRPWLVRFWRWWDAR